MHCSGSVGPHLQHGDDGSTADAGIARGPHCQTLTLGPEAIARHVHIAAMTCNCTTASCLQVKGSMRASMGGAERGA